MIDLIKIKVKAGDGGKGAVAFRHEKYYPNGGPSGGDGGRGGNIYIQVDTNETTLVRLRFTKNIKAGNGSPGLTKKMHGKDGEDVNIKVPLGTMVRNAENGDLMADLTKPGQKVLIAHGGKGGLGNHHFATARDNAPEYAQPGEIGESYELQLELRLLADAGLIGFPSVGKSTFLSIVTAARPEIAAYPFTTLEPNIGVVTLPDERSFVLADMPGLIEGASEGKGLGHEFLRHIERTRVMIHIVDAASTEGRDPVEDIYAINKELAAYNEEIAKRPQIIAANKIDAIYEDGETDPVARLKAEFEPQGIKVFPISAISGKGLKELLYEVNNMLEEIHEEPTVFEQEYFPEEATTAYNHLPYTVEYDAEEDEYVIEGPRIEKMLGYTNLESEKGFTFFQNFLKDTGILDELEALGIQEGDTVRMYGLSFDYYK